MRGEVGRRAGANIRLTDVYVCGVMDVPRRRWRSSTGALCRSVRGPRREDAYMQGGRDYHTICGPVLAMTTRNSLLAFAEGRRDARGDFGNIDIILRRSSDCGATWSDIDVLHRNGDG